MLHTSKEITVRVDTVRQQILGQRLAPGLDRPVSDRRSQINHGSRRSSFSPPLMAPNLPLETAPLRVAPTNSKKDPPSDSGRILVNMEQRGATCH